MKLQAIKRICAKNKTIHVVHVDGESFVGDGEGFYTLGDLSGIDKEVLFQIFDIKEDDAAKYDYQDLLSFPIPGVDIGVRSEDITLVTSPLSINLAGRTVVPVLLHTDQHIALYNPVYISPFTDDMRELSFCERANAQGQAYIVIKKGFSVMAVIFPDREDLPILHDRMKAFFPILRDTMIAEGYASEYPDEDRQTTFDD